MILQEEDHSLSSSSAQPPENGRLLPGDRPARALQQQWAASEEPSALREPQDHLQAAHTLKQQQVTCAHALWQVSSPSTGGVFPL